MKPVEICRYVDRFSHKLIEWDELIAVLPKKRKRQEQNARTYFEHKLQEVFVPPHTSYAAITQIRNDIDKRYQLVETRVDSLHKEVRG